MNHSKFDSIRFFHDEEVPTELIKIYRHPMFKALLHFSFPDVPEENYPELIEGVDSIQKFHEKIATQTMEQVLKNTSSGLSISGFEQLEKNTSYLFISNHRDILLDTSLLNISLMKERKVMTASAIGDNLVQKSFLLDLAKLNRNFIVKRNISPRELLVNSKLLSEYIQHLLKKENRSVWIAQREGRTKDGNDRTHSGVLKMIGMAADNMDLMDYFTSLKIVPVAISYEYDPTDKLKIPQIMAKLSNEAYSKSKNEDFVNIISGVLGQKRRIHIHVGKPLHDELLEIKKTVDTPNKQISALTKILDREIIANYKLWPTNYIAHDVLSEQQTYASEYTEQEKMLFLRRLEMRTQNCPPDLQRKILEIYARPVINKEDL